VTKAKRVFAVAAVAAVVLIVGAIMFFGSSNEQPPLSSPDSSSTNTSPIAPAGGVEARQSSLVTDNPKQEPVASKREEITPPVSAAGGAEARRASLAIENPKEGATVGMREELTGRIEPGGWPVIFVQADIPGQPWWCQAHIAKVEGGRFTAKVVFGDDFTPSGTKFRIVGIVTRTREEALKFNVGAKQALPEGFPQSEVIVVTHQ
jgi:hypothetical protein